MTFVFNFLKYTLLTLFFIIDILIILKHALILKFFLELRILVAFIFGLSYLFIALNTL
jgi:hypothetical protein